MKKMNSTLSKKLFMNINKFYSTQHCKYLIIGAGSGGKCVGSQMIKEGIVSNPKEITYLDKAEHHYYQPGFTKIGGGVYDLYDKSLIEYNMDKLTQKYSYIKGEADSVKASENKVILNDGREITYDNLVLSPGLDVNFNGTPGLVDMLDNPNANVVSVYSYEYAKKTAIKRESFRGGRALFTQPPAPIKCAGAPQKVMYLSDAYWKKYNIRADCHFFTPLPSIFGVKYYSDALEEVANQKGITRHYKRILHSFKNDKVAIFKNLETGEFEEESFDFLHVVPLMKAPELLKNSPEIIDGSGFVNVDYSMRHKKYDNIWAIGDCVALPNAKTAAAVFSQSPVLIENMKENSRKHQYCGYSACPIFIGDRRLMLAEFSTILNEKGEASTFATESFQKGGQTVPNIFYYYLTVLLGHLYPLSHGAVWYGKNHLINPITRREIKYIAFYLSANFIVLFGIGYLLYKAANRKTPKKVKKENK